MKIQSAVYGLLLAAFLLPVSVNGASAFSDGYILCGTYGASTTILIDTSGKTVRQWDHSKLANKLNGYSCYILPNGNLLRTSQAATAKSPANANPKQGAIDEVDSSGKVVWTYTLSNDTFMLHHDMKPLPNGNILAITFYTISKAKALSIGIDSALMGAGVYTLLGEKIIEIKPKSGSGGDIVWEWSMFDHIVKKGEAAAHPELISGSIVPALWQGQWVHLNGLDYCAATDRIVFSSRIFSELYVLDHGTTTQEAAGHTGGRQGKGGDILYRWGHQSNYGVSGGTTLDCLHSPTWIPEGYAGARNIMFFHNNMIAVKSQVIEIKPPLDDNGKFVCESGKAYGPVEPTWKYAPASGMYSKAMSSAIRMPNGNTIVHEAYPTDAFWEDGTIPQTDCRLREVDRDGKMLWSDTLKLKASQGFNPAKIMYYPSSYVGVRKLLGLPPVGTISNAAVASGAILPSITISQVAGSIIVKGTGYNAVNLINLQGKKVLSAALKGTGARLETARLPTGLYYAEVVENNRRVAFKAVGITK